MSHTIRDSKKYIEPMAKGEKSRHSHKRSDSGYGGGTVSDRSSHRLSGSRRSTESNHGSRGYVEPEVNIASQRYDLSALQNALQASNESYEKLKDDYDDLDKDLARSNSDNRRLRRERDAERMQNDELRASLLSARKELAKYQQKEAKKSSSKSSSKETAWKEMPVPLYRPQTPPSMPEMPRNPRPTSNLSSRPAAPQRRMSVSSSAQPSYTYTSLRPPNYGQYPGQQL